jgi:hypothetical protein
MNDRAKSIEDGVKPIEDRLESKRVITNSIESRLKSTNDKQSELTNASPRGTFTGIPSPVAAAGQSSFIAGLLLSLSSRGKSRKNF